MERETVEWTREDGPTMLRNIIGPTPEERLRTS